jgi:hypothetical protein
MVLHREGEGGGRKGGRERESEREEGREKGRAIEGREVGLDRIGW